MLRSILRSSKIAYVLARYRIDAVLFSQSRSRLLRSICFFNPWFYLPTKYTRAQRLRLALETLGPIFVKFGQVMSTRRDFLPKDITDELSLLQDHVKPFPYEIAAKMILKDLKKTPAELFANFDEEPLASASIAQVHAATLKNGDSVIVKVLRPNVKKQITQDIGLLTKVAGLVQKFHPKAKRIRPKDIVKEFELSLYAELDLNREAANAAQLQRNFKDSKDVYIPNIYWEYTSKKVMVMERISGIPIANLDALRQQGSDLKILAAKALDLFFTQVFNHNFFHADMHPGNIFISKKNVNRYILVDFGIVGSLSDEDRHYIAANLLAFFKRDYYRVAKLHVDAGWVDKGTRVFELEAAIRTVSEPVFEKPLKDISMGQLLLRLFQIAKQFNMNIQPQLVLLQKTLLNIEALGRQLDPDLDLWQTAKPFLEKWMKQQMGPRAFLFKLKRQLPFIMERLPELPELIIRGLENLVNDEKKKT